MNYLTDSERNAVQFARGVAQVQHGFRVNMRKLVNGQYNGYTGPISEAELQAERAMPEDRYV